MQEHGDFVKTDVAPPAPDTDKAIAFLQSLACRPIPLSCGYTDPETGVEGAFKTASFTDWSKVREWIEERQGHANIYYRVNPSTATGKASKADTIGVTAFQVDIDPRAATGIEPAET